MITKKKIIHIEYNMSLDFKNINTEIIRLWDSKKIDQNLKVLIYKDIPDPLLLKYCKLLTEIENSMPDEPGNPEVEILSHEIQKENDVISIVLLYKNEIIGISRIFIDDSNMKSVYQGQIGISQKYINMGYGKFLLAKTYLHLNASFNSIENITVDTHPNNSKMIYLLKQLGFKYTHTDYIYED